ncbi:hypothetical protein M378DRAFT_274039 [Amanita muscaria Koide BX008]|uniref:Uncharacterized protein n=1 Tax=Amanita muscaria (strain Koide BX008) TaxID=946122 RepID=A0A0C2XFQ4_AMAMK|nr:hypothetical protein M378DRAFT_274039 [Amanita muscaria Koide BX008]
MITPTPAEKKKKTQTQIQPLTSKSKSTPPLSADKSVVCSCQPSRVGWASNAFQAFLAHRDGWWWWLCWRRTMGGWSSMGGNTGGNVDGMLCLPPNCLIQVGTASVHQVDVAIHSGRDENMGRG